MNEQSFDGVVLMNSEGLYLQIRERDTHTGRHVDITTTPSIDEADVFRPGHLLHLHRQQDLSEYSRIPARVVNKRMVTRL